jgi:hypothetical protein
VRRNVDETRTSQVMSTLAAPLRQIFPARAFGPPASLEAVEVAESAIGSRIPSPLRELYLEFDGFHGPTAIPFLYRLGSADDAASLVGWNLWVRGAEEFSGEFMRRYLFFGSDGCGGHWALPLAEAAAIVRWYPDVGERMDTLSTDFVAFWSEQKSLYD